MKINNKTILLSCILLLMLFTQNVFATSDINSFAHNKTVTFDEDGFVKVQIDNEIYDKTQKELSDIRIFDEDGEEIPYYINRRDISQNSDLRPGIRPKEIEKQIEIVDRIMKNEWLEFTLQRDDTKLINRLKIEFDIPEYIFEIEIEASDDERNWGKIRSDNYLYSLPNEKNLRKNTIEFDENNFKYIRVRIKDIYDQKADKNFYEDLRIIAYAIYEKDELFRREKIETQIIKNETKDNKTEIIIDTFKNNSVVDFFKFNISDENFSRSVFLFGSNELDDWKKFCENEITSFSYKEHVVRDTEIDCRTGRYRYIQIIIKNEDDRPLDIQSIEVFRINEYIIFEAEKDKEYIVAFGNSTVDKPSYDISKLMRDKNIDDMPEASLSQIIQNTEFKGEDKSIAERYKWLFWVFIVLMVFVLGALTITNLKSILKEK